MQKNRYDLLLNAAKIAIIVFFAVAILSNFVPFFENVSNSYVYGLQTIRLLEESSWSISNELLEDTGSWDFVPGGWKKTIHDTAIPKHPPGLPVIGTIFYLVGGLYGLFYLGPIFAIALLVVSERIATNLFGKYVGFLTLLFLATNGYIFSTGKFLLADNLFALLTIVSFFCLIKFISNKNNKYLLGASFLFVIATFVRVNGIVYFPIEIFIVLLFLLLQNKRFQKLILIFNRGKIINESKNFTKHNISKITLFVAGPWLIYILFFVSFNDYYFGDPLTTFYNIPDDPWIKAGTGSFLSIFEFNPEHGETIKAFSNYVLPYPIYRIELLDFDKIITERNDLFTSNSLILLQGLVGQNNLGLLTFLMLIIATMVSFYSKNRMIVISTWCFVVFSSIMFWASNQIAYGLSPIITGRYMLPTFPFMSMILGFLIVKFIETRKFNHTKTAKLVIKTLKIIFIIILVLFFSIALYNSPAVQLIKNDEFEFNNPVEHVSYYPLDLEGVEQNSIMVGGFSAHAIDYGFITFFPYKGLNLSITGFILEDVDHESIETLKELSKGDRELIMFKGLTTKNQKLFNEALVKEYGFILEDFSPTFCKVKFIEGLDLKIAIEKSDEVCYK